jgi:hypothetical protein
MNFVGSEFERENNHKLSKVLHNFMYLVGNFHYIIKYGMLEDYPIISVKTDLKYIYEADIEALVIMLHKDNFDLLRFTSNKKGIILQILPNYPDFNME